MITRIKYYLQDDNCTFISEEMIGNKDVWQAIIKKVDDRFNGYISDGTEQLVCTSTSMPYLKRILRRELSRIGVLFIDEVKKGRID